MPDELLLERLELVLESLEAIELYVEPIVAYTDFKQGHGKLIFDAILMRLQVVGEIIKKISKKAPSLLPLTDEEISSIIRFRDFISHHYEKSDTELVFQICTLQVPRLKQQIQELLNSYK